MSCDQSYLTGLFEKGNRGKSVWVRLVFPVFVNLGGLKEFEKIGIEFAVVDRKLQNLQGALHGNRFLIRPVGGGQGVKDIGNGHDARLQWNFRGGGLIR